MDKAYEGDKMRNKAVENGDLLPVGNIRPKNTAKNAWEYDN
jgi:hypothetical protein